MPWSELQEARPIRGGGCGKNIFVSENYNSSCDSLSRCAHDIERTILLEQITTWTRKPLSSTLHYLIDKMLTFYYYGLLPVVVRLLSNYLHILVDNSYRVR